MKPEVPSPQGPVSPEPDHINGLPLLDRESHAILTSGGEVAVATHRTISTYQLGAHNCQTKGAVELREPVVALAESSSGLVAATHNALHSVTTHGVREIVALDGVIRSIAVAGPHVFAAVGKKGRLDGTLVQVDLQQSVIVSERSLHSAAVTLTTDPNGSYLGISDGRTFQTMQVAPGNPCPPAAPPATPPARSHNTSYRPSTQLLLL